VPVHGLRADYQQFRDVLGGVPRTWAGQPAAFMTQLVTRSPEGLRLGEEARLLGAMIDDVRQELCPLSRAGTGSPCGRTAWPPPRPRRSAVTVLGRKGDVVVGRDEHIRPDAGVEALARLRPILGAQDPEATVTAGNASGQNDGAAVCIVTSPQRAAELGLRPLVRLVSCAVAGVPPATMGIGPVPATAKALDTAGLSLSDVDLIELNEAFADQVLP
jgi:hypothetical protein